jgi:hypothetical protein
VIAGSLIKPLWNVPHPTAKEKAVSLTQPADCISRSMKRPQSRHHDAHQDAGTDRWQELRLEIGNLRHTHLQILISGSRGNWQAPSKAPLDCQVRNERHFGEARERVSGAEHSFRIAAYQRTEIAVQTGITVEDRHHCSG